MKTISPAARQGTPPRRALLYLRQSTYREESISLNVQESLGRDYCTRQGYDIVGVVADPGFSGRQMHKRPGLQEALTRAQAGEFDLLIVYRWSRLSRRALDQQILLATFSDAGVEVESSIEPMDTRTAAGTFSRNMLLSFAAFESDLRSEQWKEAHDRRVSQGLPSGGAIRFGYMRNPDDPGGAFILHPEESAILADLYRRFIAGEGMQSLANWLNTSGVPARRVGRGASAAGLDRPWIPASVQRILDSGFGAGLVKHRGDLMPGAHPRVISPEVWERYLTARRLRFREQAGRRAGLDDSTRWHLTDLARCGRCGSPLVINSYRSERSMALCSLWRSSRRCQGVTILRARIEDVVALWLGGRVEEWAAAAEAARPDRTQDKLRADAVTRVEAARAGVTTVAAKRGRLVEMRLNGEITEAEHRELQDKLLMDTEQAEAALTAAQDVLDTLPSAEDLDDVYERIQVAVQAQGDEPEVTGLAWRNVLAKIVKEVRLTPDAVVVVPHIGAEATYLRASMKRRPRVAAGG